MLMSCDMRMGGDAVDRSTVVRARRSPLSTVDALWEGTSAVLEVVGFPSPRGMAIESGGGGLVVVSSNDLLPTSVFSNAGDACSHGDSASEYMSRGCESPVVLAMPVTDAQDHAPTIGLAGLSRDMSVCTLGSESSGRAADDASSIVWPTVDMISRVGNGRTTLAPRPWYVP